MAGNKNKNIQTILILGGYGNAGRLISKLLLQETTSQRLIIAGRHLESAQAFVEELASSDGNENSEQRLEASNVDASSLTSLQEAFKSIDMVVVASSTTSLTSNVLQAALAAKIDYFDIQIHSDESPLLDMQPQIQASGQYFVTDGGFHPGIPAALVRHVDQMSRWPLVSADLYIFMQLNWNEIQLSETTKQEFWEEIKVMDNRIYSKESKWKEQGWNVQRDYDFGANYKTQTAVPIYLHELRDLVNTLKQQDSLQNLGAYISGFNPITIFLVLPICMLVSWLFPKRQVVTKSMANLFSWSLKKFTSPPYGAVLALEARTEEDGGDGTDKPDDESGSPPSSEQWSIRLAHTDAYLFTAVPAVACILQMLDGTGTVNKPAGWYRQAILVEPKRFLADMERLGLEVSIEKKKNAKQLEESTETEME